MSAKPIESDLEKQQEDPRMKRRFEQGEGSSIAGISNEQVNKVVVTITTMTNENTVKITQHTTRYFHQVIGLLQMQTNTVLETREPHVGVLQRASKVCMGRKVWLV